MFYGGCCRGKTHLSIALGILATERGYRVRYFETSSLVLMLKAAVADNRLETALKDIAKADLLIVDRIMHHGRLVEFGGQSRRFEKALMMGRSEG